MKVLLTGASGFLGWHTRLRLELIDGHDVVAVDRSSWGSLRTLARDADAVIHVAGVNRGPEGAVEQGNVDLADELVAALATARRCRRVIFANSIQAGRPTPYGTGKARASDVLRTAAADHGFDYVDVLLPNLFGEGGRPRYNSFVATFVDEVIAGRVPTQVDDRPIGLLHVQAASRCLSDALSSAAAPAGPITPPATATSVWHVLQRLIAHHDGYVRADLPQLQDELDLDLFNTLRFAMFPAGYPLDLESRTDDRGRLVELVRARTAGGQTFVSTSGPGVTRGDHFHVRKVERFVVLAGRAHINLRRLYDNRVVTFEVDGSVPVAIDMPTLWTHNIVNVSGGELVTMFWTNELFDPDRPDTIRCPVTGDAADRRALLAVDPVRGGQGRRLLESSAC